MNEPEPRFVGYVGFVTRAVALLIDAITINLIALLLTAALRGLLSLFGSIHTLDPGQILAGGVAWLIWSGGYFLLFWAFTGQTPGARLIGFRVYSANGGRVGLRRANRRLWGFALSFVTLGAGFVPVLYDDRRRGLHDRLGGTVVLWDPPEWSREREAARAAAAAIGVGIPGAPQPFEGLGSLKSTDPEPAPNPHDPTPDGAESASDPEDRSADFTRVILAPAIEARPAR